MTHPSLSNISSWRRPASKNILQSFGPFTGRTEVLDGSAAEDIVILEFPTYKDAKAWSHGSTYQVASKHRYQGGDYRFILTEGISAH